MNTEHISHISKCFICVITFHKSSTTPRWVPSASGNLNYSLLPDSLRFLHLHFFVLIIQEEFSLISEHPMFYSSFKPSSYSPSTLKPSSQNGKPLLQTIIPFPWNISLPVLYYVYLSAFYKVFIIVEWKYESKGLYQLSLVYTVVASSFIICLEWLCRIIILDSPIIFWGLVPIL